MVIPERPSGRVSDLYLVQKSSPSVVEELIEDEVSEVPTSFELFLNLVDMWSIIYSLWRSASNSTRVTSMVVVWCPIHTITFLILKMFRNGAPNAFLSRFLSMPLLYTFETTAKRSFNRKFYLSFTSPSCFKKKNPMAVSSMYKPFQTSTRLTSRVLSHTNDSVTILIERIIFLHKGV